MKRLLLVLILHLIFFNCANDITRSKLLDGNNSKELKFQFVSSDIFLVKMICNSIEKSFKGKCVSASDENLDSNDNESVKQIYIETQIRDSSSDYFQNAGKSLLTLTIGIFLTNSAEVDFVFFIKNEKDTLLENTSISSFGKTGYWGMLPIYTGFIATNFGTLLNSYRKPDNLQRFCLYENPSNIRQILEAKREDYCKDYELFLEDSFNKVDKFFFQIIQETNSHP